MLAKIAKQYGRNKNAALFTAKKEFCESVNSTWNGWFYDKFYGRRIEGTFWLMHVSRYYFYYTQSMTIIVPLASNFH